jgi:alkyl hydroperoxide reductase subunit AhpF
VIIAAGVAYRMIDAAGLDWFGGLGVFYTPLTARDELRAGGPVVIVGGGNSLFVLVGAAPRAEWLARHVLLDDRGFIVTGVGSRAGCAHQAAVAITVRFVSEHLGRRHAFADHRPG